MKLFQTTGWVGATKKIICQHSPWGRMARSAVKHKENTQQFVDVVVVKISFLINTLQLGLVGMTVLYRNTLWPGLLPTPAGPDRLIN